jgi:hypothetical protein
LRVIKKEYQNYIFIVLGFLILFLIYLFHWIDMIYALVVDYNHLRKFVVDNYNFSENYKNVNFLGNVLTVSLLIDLIFIVIIILIFMIIYLKIRWSHKNG